MRIIGGSARGRRLLGPGRQSAIRPTADRVRESLFNVLGQRCDGLTVLDLYAGTGALALESLSRGAVAATLVDSGAEALALARANIEALGFSGVAEVLALPVERALNLLERRGRRFELVFADPPYGRRAGTWVLTNLAASKLLAERARVVIEHRKDEKLEERYGGLSHIGERRFGDTVLSLFSRGSPDGILEP